MEEGHGSNDQNEDASEGSSMPAIGSPVSVPDVQEAFRNMQAYMNELVSGESSEHLLNFEMSSSSSPQTTSPRHNACRDLFRKAAIIHTQPGNPAPSSHPIHGLRGLETPPESDTPISYNLDMASPVNSQDSSLNGPSAVAGLVTHPKPVSDSTNSEIASRKSPRSSNMGISRISPAEDFNRQWPVLQFSTPLSSRNSTDTTDTSVFGVRTGYQSGFVAGCNGVNGYGAIGPTSQAEVAISGGCPACRFGTLDKRFTWAGIFCAVCLFPCGIVYCMANHQKRCSDCGAVFD